VRYRFVFCDVFTDRLFGGNPLAVLPDARGLSSARMQQIAREFNFSESTFVLPAEAGHTRRVRIFTPTKEIPFAGHPNVGTAFVLTAIGELGDPGESFEVTFEEKAGLVPVAISKRDGGKTVPTPSLGVSYTPDWTWQPPKELAEPVKRRDPGRSSPPRCIYCPSIRRRTDSISAVSPADAAPSSGVRSGAARAALASSLVESVVK